MKFVDKMTSCQLGSWKLALTDSKMAARFVFRIKLATNYLSANLFYCSRLSVNYGLAERKFSQSFESDKNNDTGSKTKETSTTKISSDNQNPFAAFPNDTNPKTGEKGGPRGPEPTRYGDWERKGRCIDF